MKYRILSLLAFAGALFSSCVKENLPAEGGSILAVMENDDTRTSVTDEGKFTWSEGDQIWLHTTSGGVVGTLSDGAGTSSAEFSYDYIIGDMTGRAVYPYNEGHSISGDVLSVAMPSSYDLGSNLTNTNAAMYGELSDDRLKFNHLAGVMRFKFKNVPAGVNKFTITLDKKINGTFTADLTETYPVIEASEASTDSERTITLNFTALTETSDIALYVPLPLGTYNSLELGLYADNQSLWTYSNAVSNTISRKSLILMPTITLGGTIGGDIEGGESDENSEPDSQLSDYIDEYGINHGPGVKIGETVWAPVNCGYHATDYKYGKLYQWGRKYGQGYDGDFYDEDHNIIGVYCDKYVPNRVAGPVSLLVGQSKGNEDKFYYNSNYPCDWLVVRDDNLWNLGTEDYPVKTEYDPCPEGWRVPTYLELDYLDDNYSPWTTDKNGLFGYWFSGTEFYSELVSQVFLPAAGYCHMDDGIANHRGHSGFYRSSRPYDDGAWSNYFCSSSVWVDFNNRRSYGYSVRCVQDNSPMVLVESVNLSKTSTTLSVGESETLSAAILPSNANHQHAHWSSDDSSVVTVDSEGKITAVSAGAATITAMAGMQVATCKVTVNAVPSEPVEPKEGDYIDEYGINHGPGVKIGETVWAPVNCGYHATDYKYGKLYQWGRKYGQGYSGSLYDGDWNYICEYSDASVPEMVEGPVSLSVGQSEANDSKFYYNSTSPYHWLTSQDDNLWNSGTEDNPVKTEYDPCPEGWRVPTYSELSELKSNHSSWTTDENDQTGYWFSGANMYTESVPKVFFPAAGEREGGYGGSAGEAMRRGRRGYYWSSRPSDEFAYYLCLDDSAIFTYDTFGRSNGFSVRCLQVTD